MSDTENVEAAELEALRRLYRAAIGSDAYSQHQWSEEATADYAALRSRLSRSPEDEEPVAWVLERHTRDGWVPTNAYLVEPWTDGSGTERVIPLYADRPPTLRDAT